jgi:hypothetical protein
LVYAGKISDRLTWDSLRRRSPDHRTRRCCQNRLGDAVRLALERIIDSTDFELCLNGEARARKEWLHLKPLRTARRKDRNLAEIPRGRCLLEHRVLDVRFFFLHAGFFWRYAPALRQKPKSCLVADGGQEQVCLLEWATARTMLNHRRALKHRFIVRA